jgi:hypothetical protein
MLGSVRSVSLRRVSRHAGMDVSSIDSQERHAKGPECRTVSPQGASRVPGMDITHGCRRSRQLMGCSAWKRN